MAPTLNYPKTQRNTVNRLNHLASYDCRSVHTIVNESPVIQVGFAGPDGYPAVLPFIGAMGSFEDPTADVSQPLNLYVHGYVSSRVMNYAKKDGGPLKVGVNASIVDGCVLASSAFHHNLNFRSAVLQGEAEVVSDLEEKMWALKLITDKIVEDRFENSRHPIPAREIQPTSVMRIKIVSASAKIHTGTPHDDEEDMVPEVTSKVWSGVIPIYHTYGVPIPSDYNGVNKVPTYITDFIQSKNEENKLYVDKISRMPAI